jgi:protein-tyrosine phosphatase
MIPLVDMHVHLLAGLHDGPRTDEEALDMCRIASADGTRLAAALAHQNEHYPQVTPTRIRQAAQHLAQRLAEKGVPLTVFPCAEIMAHADLETAWQKGDLLSVADRGQYLLVAMPPNLVMDLRDAARRFCQQGVRLILAHPERLPPLLHSRGLIEELIGLGCLVQVSAESVTDPPSRADGRALKDWLKRGVVHFLGSDGHSPTRRRPFLAAAYRQISQWVGAAAAERVCSTNGIAVLEGEPLNVPAPEPPRRGWFSWS